jgi:SAM-dependent methyltransferase
MGSYSNQFRRLAMGILRPHIHILCLEQGKHPVIKGDVLTLGQQAVYATLQDVRSILASHRNVQVKELPAGFDTNNKIPSWKGTRLDKYTNAHSLLTLLGADHVYVADISAYEGPDFLIDLNFPVSDSYHERFDAIVDVGTLEHVFDIAVALNNICRMLKKGGSVVLILPCSNAIDHGFYSFSPTLLYDYFNANGFSNIGCYLREGSPYVYERKGRLWRYDRVGAEIPIVSCQGIEVAFVATKEREYRLQETAKPIQSIYRESEYWNASAAELSPVGDSSMRGKVKKLARSILYYFKDCIPVSVDKFVYGRKRGKNLKYLGKY